MHKYTRKKRGNILNKARLPFPKKREKKKKKLLVCKLPWNDKREKKRKREHYRSLVSNGAILHGDQTAETFFSGNVFPTFFRQKKGKNECRLPPLMMRRR